MRAPVVSCPLTGWVSPEWVVAALGATGDVVWFDAGHTADEAGSAPLPGHPTTSLIGWGDRVLTGFAAESGSLESAWRELGERDGDRAQDPPLGWWGWLGYGAGIETPDDAEASPPVASPLAPRAEAPVEGTRPDLAFLDVGRALVFDHRAGTARIVADAGQEAWVETVVAWWAVAVRSTEPGTVDPDVDEARSANRSDRAVEWADSDDHYLQTIGRCQAAIREGTAYQLCLTTSAEVDLDTDELTVYRRLRRDSPAPRASFVRIGRTALLGASPETFLTVDASGTVTSSPIKGTRPRGGDAHSDRLLRDELLASEKERAENLMIVDLVRNDLSRVAAPGTVDVTELFSVRSYRHVHQLVSTVSAQLAPGRSGLDAVRAAFPPGSMTGAPKRSAVGLLKLLESRSRGPYSGAAGRLGRDGTVDLAVVIRTIVVDLDTRRARIGVGGGITSSSIPGQELAEVKTKAAALLAAARSA